MKRLIRDVANLHTAGWKDMPRKKINVILERNSAEKIVSEWNDFLKLEDLGKARYIKLKKSIHVDGLIKRLEKQLASPARKEQK